MQHGEGLQRQREMRQMRGLMHSILRSDSVASYPSTPVTFVRTTVAICVLRDPEGYIEGVLNPILVVVWPALSCGSSPGVGREGLPTPEFGA